MARETEQERRRPEADTTTTDPATTAAPTSSSSFTSHGQIPGVQTATAQPGPSASDRAFGPKTGGPEIDATSEAMGKHMTEGMDRANVAPGSNGQYDIHHGIHYWYNYKSECEQAGKADLWKDEYRYGHTEAKQFVNPHETGNFMDWSLKKGQSASQAIKDWLKGATVAECLSTVVALEIDTLRASIGDKKFDKLFGSADAKEDASVAPENRMHVRASIQGTPVANYMKATALADHARQGGQFGTVPEAELDKELIPGQWYYFYNHPKYLLKHPGGAWQGENSLYMGKNEAGERMWSGLGATASEDAMLDEMVQAYNAPRDDYDHRMLKEQGVEGADGTYKDPLYDPKSGKFPDTVSKQDIVSSQPFAIGRTTRKGGLLETAGMELDAKKVQKTRDTE